jgi:hypothetical protein
MFLGRVHAPPGTPIRNVDFPVEDVDSSAEWLKNVKAQNYELGVATGRVAMTGGGEEEMPAGENEANGYKWTESGESVEVRFN